MQTAMNMLRVLRRWARAAGPYLMLALLPGGTLLAVLLFVHRRPALRPTLAGGLGGPDVELGPARTTMDERILKRSLP